MLFNSNFFIYIFLPSLFFIYYSAIHFTKHSVTIANIVLLLYSILFYLCTGGSSILILLFAIVANYFCALAIDYFYKYKKIFLALGLIVNFGMLIFYKYSYFLYSNINEVFHFSNDITDRLLGIVLPIGISFFLFQATSYLIDVYKCEVSAQRNLGKFALYISLFPQLVAGPIVRYTTISEEIENRKVTITDVYEGLCRFIFGLGKKVLIADLLGSVVDIVWGQGTNISISLAWYAAFLYTLQIYFDFSGYSDMAIGLGKMLGFNFLENFVLPYTSQNVTEFWKRWHISLSSFLKDYLYIPLGGNRKGTFCTYRNLFIVFLICGLWHGAAWNFIVWGIYHGTFLIIERILKNKFSFSMKGIVGKIFLFLIVMIGWVLFRANSVTDALTFLQIMFGKQNEQMFSYYSFGYYVYPKIAIVSILAFIASFFKFEKTRIFIIQSNLKGIFAVIILLISILYMSDASFTPFIYFQF